MRVLTFLKFSLLLIFSILPNGTHLTHITALEETKQCTISDQSGEGAKQGTQSVGDTHTEKRELIDVKSVHPRIVGKMPEEKTTDC